MVLVMWKCKEYNTFALVRSEKCKEDNIFFCPPMVLVMWKRKEHNTFALVWFEECKEYSTWAAHVA